MRTRHEGGGRHRRRRGPAARRHPPHLWTLALAAACMAATTGCGSASTTSATSGSGSGSATFGTDPAGPSPGSSSPGTDRPGTDSPGRTGGADPTSPLSTSTPRPPVGADLTITVSDGRTSTTTYTLTCQPTGGTHPQPATACDELAQRGMSGFAPVPVDAVCTDIAGGPQTATVTGTVGGTPVNAAFNRIGGCEIDRWNALTTLLGPISSDI